MQITGSFSGRDFEPEFAGGELRKLSTEGVKISLLGIAVVRMHVARFGDDPANQHMVDRLESIARNLHPVTAADINFYVHELREFVRYRRLGWKFDAPADADEAHRIWNNTHTATLEEYGIVGRHTTKLLYHPDAIELM